MVKLQHKIVLFVGKGNPPPTKFELKDEFQMQSLSFNFIVLDMKKIDSEVFIKVEIEKDEKEIAKYIDSVSFLAGLFDIKIEVKPMPIEVDIKETFLYKWGKEEGLKEGKMEGLKEGLKEEVIGIVFSQKQIFF
jgi:predicted transposase YdaD